MVRKVMLKLDQNCVFSHSFPLVLAFIPVFIKQKVKKTLQIYRFTKPSITLLSIFLRRIPIARHQAQAALIFPRRFHSVKPFPFIFMCIFGRHIPFYSEPLQCSPVCRLSRYSVNYFWPLLNWMGVIDSTAFYASKFYYVFAHRYFD